MLEGKGDRGKGRERKQKMRTYEEHNGEHK